VGFCSLQDSWPLGHTLVGSGDYCALQGEKDSLDVETDKFSTQSFPCANLSFLPVRTQVFALENWMSVEGFRVEVAVRFFQILATL